jgi:hypothetical protein
MSHQMTITLTDAEYKALSIEAAQDGKPLESLLHEMLIQRIKLSASAKRQLNSYQIFEYLYGEGIIEHIPTGEPITPEEEAERERLALLFGQGKPVSEMVIEDRGPR